MKSIIEQEACTAAGGLDPVCVIPQYLKNTYNWAYLRPGSVRLLDREWIVSAILWGNARRLMRGAVAEFSPGRSVLQAAAVYGPFSALLAEQITSRGHLDVVDVAPVQLRNTERKTHHLSHVTTHRADLALPLAKTYDDVCAFFLLHEVPQEERTQIVDNLLAAVRPGGKAVFVDYHRPHAWHPLRPVMRAVFHLLEPFAPSLLDQSIETLSPRGKEFAWSKRTLFGGLYQHVVAIRGSD